jgi:hypothetical protein
VDAYITVCSWLAWCKIGEKFIPVRWDKTFIANMENVIPLDWDPTCMAGLTRSFLRERSLFMGGGGGGGWGGWHRREKGWVNEKQNNSRVG